MEILVKDRLSDQRQNQDADKRNPQSRKDHDQEFLGAIQQVRERNVECHANHGAGDECLAVGNSARALLGSVKTRDKREKHPFNDKQSQIAERRTVDQQGPGDHGKEAEFLFIWAIGKKRYVNDKQSKNHRATNWGPTGARKNAARTPQDEKVPGRHYTRDAGTRAAEARAGASAPHRARARDRASSEEA
jgi:hypothetical protein